MKILPGPPGSGIVFRRVDLDGFEVQATGRNVARVSYATSLMKKGVLISTTEHLLSALVGTGIDNAVVELDNLEVPILDGSALPFVEAIRKAGIRKQRRPRTYLRICRELELREKDKFIAVYPSDTYSVSYTINFPHPMIGKETFRVDLSNGNYLREMAPARTSDRARTNAPCATWIDPRGFAGKLHRAQQEWDRKSAGALSRRVVRHKILDLMGDLALGGKTDSGERGRRPGGPCHAHGPGVPLAPGQYVVGRNDSG